MSAAWRALAAGLLALPLLSGCPKKEDVVVETGGVELTAADIDAQPLNLLPGDAIGIVSLDTTAMFASEFGARMLQITQQRMPVPPSAGFEPKRDLQRLHLGFYSMSGADFVGVAVGTFNREAIEAAADGTAQTPLGAPLVKVSYAKRTIYVSKNVGFSVLTSRTALVGNETGIRRALDRLDRGEFDRATPSWLDPLLNTKQAAIVGGVDLRHGVTAEAKEDFTFLQGMETTRFVGNFEPPGLNLAGTSSYPDEESAKRGAASLRDLHETMRSLGFLTTLLSIGQPLHRLEVQESGKEVKYVAEVNGNAVAWAIERLAEMLGVAPATVQANTSAPVDQAPPGTPPGAVPPGGGP